MKLFSLRFQQDKRLFPAILAGVCLMLLPAVRADGDLTPAAGLDNLTTDPQSVASTVQPVSARISYLASSTYRLGPNDEIDVSFFSAPELNQKGLRVTPDGFLMFPAVGEIKVADMTLGELNALLTERYRKYLRQPKLAINLAKLKPYVVYIKGSVLKPGQYEFNPNPSDTVQQLNGGKEFNVSRTSPLLSSVLIAAGGLTHEADIEHVEIYNQYTKEKIEINILDLLNPEKDQDAKDIYLSQGDIVTVPMLPSALAVDPKKYQLFMGSALSQSAIPVRIYGYVKTPGQYNLPASQGNTLHSALSAAGGYPGDFAFQPSKVYISRVDRNDRIATMAVDPRNEDPRLMPNDILYVPDKAISKVHRSFRIITDLLDPVFRGASAYNNWALVFDPTRNFR